MNKNKKLITKNKHHIIKTVSGTSQKEPFNITLSEVMGSKDRLCFYKYTNSFIYSPSLSEKRFSRFVEKVTNILLEFCRELYPNQKIYNLTEWFIEALYYNFSFYVLDKNTKDREYDFAKLEDEHCIEFDINFKETKDNMTNYLADPYSKEDMSVQKIITNELYNSCKKFIAKKTITEPDLDESNYVNRGIPETSVEKLELLEDIFNRCVVSIERLNSKDLSVGTIELIKDKAVIKIFEENEEIKSRIKELEEERKRILFQMNEEKKQKEAALKKFQKVSGGEKMVPARKYYELYKKHVQLQKNFNRVCVKKQPKFPVLKRIRKKQPKLDSFGNYVFVMNPELRMCKRIMAEFPNARIISGTKKIDLENADMVIAMTRSISHAWYYSVKGQCKANGVPFIHCPTTNMDELKLLIRNNKQ